jgi:heptosyltransferase-1
VKVLFVKLGAIGDIIQALPALSAVRTAMPDAEISWVAEERSAEILRGNPLIDYLIEVNTRSIRSQKTVDELLSEIKKQAGELRKHRYDVALDFQGLLKSAMIAKLSRAKKRFGFDRKSLREPASRIFLTDTVEIPAGIHVIEKNLSLAASALDFKWEKDQLSFSIHTDEVHRGEADEAAARVTGKFAILNPAGGWVTKLWHAEKYGQLADQLWEERGLVSIVVTGPDESELADRVMANSRAGKTISVQPSLKGYFELVKHAEIYVGGDTGPTHLAIAAGTPVVGIFGPTEWWRNGSPNPDDICVERNDIDCRVDCHRRTCSKWICMDIDVETVFRAVEKRIETACMGNVIRTEAVG